MDKKIVLARIDELMREKGITGYQLRENADISSTIYQWKKNARRDKDRTPSLRSIEKICEYFGVSLAYFFSFDRAERLNSKVSELADVALSLNEEQLDLLLAVAKQFPSEKG